ncbi:hypothetical protein L226DRAFT_605416, partial [Lentinus tigrinus ALCF2SS1-7]|uniref:uncharacterized protein n=1 Tax=Lentinus tigrinus ALCF2SS1-7 TaxID=1328758 RepID=UPI001165FD71
MAMASLKKRDWAVFASIYKVDGEPRRRIDWDDFIHSQAMGALGFSYGPGGKRSGSVRGLWAPAHMGTLVMKLDKPHGNRERCFWPKDQTDLATRLNEHFDLHIMLFGRPVEPEVPPVEPEAAPVEPEEAPVAEEAQQTTDGKEYGYPTFYFAGTFRKRRKNLRRPDLIGCRDLSEESADNDENEICGGPARLTLLASSGAVASPSASVHSTTAKPSRTRNTAGSVVAVCWSSIALAWSWTVDIDSSSSITWCVLQLSQQHLERSLAQSLYTRIGFWLARKPWPRSGTTTVAKEKPDLNLDVQVLPQVPDDPVFVKSLNHNVGVLAVGMQEVNDSKGGKTLKGIPFMDRSARLNELYNWDWYLIGLGLLVDDYVNMANGMVDDFIFEIKHWGKKILNVSRMYYLSRTHPPFLTDMALQIYNQLDRSDMEVNCKWLKHAIKAAIKECHTIWDAEPRMDPKTDGLGTPAETEARHLTHILEPYAAKHGLCVLEFCERYNHESIKEAALDEYFLHDHTDRERESGHDTTYRLEKRCEVELVRECDRVLDALGWPKKFEVRAGLLSGKEEWRGKLSLDRPKRQWDYPMLGPGTKLWLGSALNDMATLRMRSMWNTDTLRNTITTAFVDFNGVVPEKFCAVKQSHVVDAEYGNQSINFKMVPREGLGSMNG